MSDVELLPLTEDHLEMVREWRNSVEVNNYMYTEVNATPPQQIKWFKYIDGSDKYKYWVVYYEHKPLGVVNLADIDYQMRQCSWAFYLGDTSIRGQGIGSKIEYNVITHVFDEMDLNKLNCEVFVTNDGVIRMHEKFGFRREAYYRDHCYKNNNYYDVVGLGLLRRDWQKIEPFMRKKLYGSG